ncbi:MAG: TIGR00282 family metallophosphoesterase [Aestuariivita sp.]|nr:TIGR00282 family metallophosphoesterase [Aestuariivita sp.]MCY4347150.1 TIGR00282 family metallophosphoesterase [Aestuariivita sp.]
MRILFFGDVMGRAGREALTTRLPKLKRESNVDFVVANAENATNGLGLSPQHASDLLAAGVDCITLGDHAFDQKTMVQYVENEPRIIRPINYARNAPGRGHQVYTTTDGGKILVAQVLGQIFMRRPFDSPFWALKPVLGSSPLGGLVQAAIIDVHCEATSEKTAMGYYCDGRVSLVAGTHTHVPTADARILSKGTAYISDVGMCGDYNSIIGIAAEEPMQRFVMGMAKKRFTPAKGEATLSAVIVDVDNRTGLARSIEHRKIGGVLGNLED